MAVESGIREQILQFVREGVNGVTPANPAWLRYSDTTQAVSLSPTPVISERRRVGSPDVQDFSAGSEDHAFSVTYDLQRWFVDGSDDPLDASYDGIMRAAQGEAPNTHSIIMRDRLGGAGALGGGSYSYTHVTGAKVNNVTMDGEPESGEPITVTLDYLAEKSRVYKVDWPTTAVALTVSSTNAADTTQELTIETWDGSTSETVELNGTTDVTTIATFASIGGFWLSAETEGNIVVENAGGDVVLTIYGRAAYQDREGDRGFPLLGSGSHASAINSAFEIFLGDRIDSPENSPFMNNADISSMSLTVNNNLDPRPSHLTIGKRLNEGIRNIQLSAEVYGPSVTFDSVTQHLRIASNDIYWHFSGGVLQLTGAVLTEMGDIARETDLATLTMGNTFTAKGIVIDPA